VLEHAAFMGRVLATDGRASIRGESLRAEFTPDAEGRARLSRVVAEDKNRVLARSDEDRKLEAEYVDVAFGPGTTPRRPEPTTLIARGRVEAADRGAELSCGRLEADLIRDDRGRPTVRRAVVRDRVVFAQREDDVSAAGDAATVDAQKAEARYENGVLTITLPKREDAKPKAIDVKVRS